MPFPVLHHALLTAPNASPARWVLFLHGLFGSGANWRSFAQRLVEQRPEWGAVLVDLRMHGASQDFPPPHTVAAAAADLTALERGLPGPVRGVLGHSFGGKVALAYVSQGQPVEHAWILDSMPGPLPEARGSATTVEVLALLESLEPVIPTREEFIARVQAGGFSRPMAQWLAMNLTRVPGGFGLRLHLPSLRALLDDYYSTDLWHAVEAPPAGLQLHLVLGGMSAAFNEEAKARLTRATERSPQLDVHTLTDAGHWVHVDDPEGLFQWVLSTLPPE